MSEGPVTPQQRIETVRTYLGLAEAGRLDEADALLAEGAFMVFPGGHRYASCRERSAHSRLLYNSVRKTPEQFVAIVDEHGRDGVLTWGTLSGTDLDGEPFEGVRYADLFILNEDGQIAEQYVWNDLAAEGVSPPWPASHPVPMGTSRS
jgi:hypothetical protein